MSELIAWRGWLVGPNPITVFKASSYSQIHGYEHYYHPLPWSPNHRVNLLDDRAIHESGNLWSVFFYFEWLNPTVSISSNFPKAIGFHTLKEPIPPTKHDSMMGTRGKFIGATGSVALSGRVIEHEHGYRAQRVTLRSILLDRRFMRHVQHMQDLYQCDVTAVDHDDLWQWPDN